jgi:sn-glycerol 3-phosphate transport system permease protein
VVTTLGWVDTYAGLTIPLIASATATFLFRQFYMTIPDELVDAAKIDGSGPLRFLWSILLPNSGANIAALFVVMFIYGWNQYLWPLMVTNSEKMKVVVVGIASTIPTGTQLPEWNLVMATAMMAILPPVLIVLFMQRWFVHGLIESEK